MKEVTREGPTASRLQSNHIVQSLCFNSVPKHGIPNEYQAMLKYSHYERDSDAEEREFETFGKRGWNHKAVKLKPFENRETIVSKGY